MVNSEILAGFCFFPLSVVGFLFVLFTIKMLSFLDSTGVKVLVKLYMRNISSIHKHLPI